jgi:hypothetical protein
VAVSGVSLKQNNYGRSHFVDYSSSSSAFTELACSNSELLMKLLTL